MDGSNDRLTDTGGVRVKEYHPSWVQEVGWVKVDHFVFASPIFFFNSEVATF